MIKHFQDAENKPLQYCESICHILSILVALSKCIFWLIYLPSKTNKQTKTLPAWPERSRLVSEV